MLKLTNKPLQWGVCTLNSDEGLRKPVQPDDTNMNCYQRQTSHYFHITLAVVGGASFVWKGGDDIASRVAWEFVQCFCPPWKRSSEKCSIWSWRSGSGQGVKLIGALLLQRDIQGLSQFVGVEDPFPESLDNDETGHPSNSGLQLLTATSCMWSPSTTPSRPLNISRI